MVRITLMYYVDFYSLFNTPKRNGISFFPRLSMHLLNHLFLIKVGLINKKYDSNAVKLAFESYFIAFSEFYRTAIIHFIL